MKSPFAPAARHRGAMLFAVVIGVVVLAMTMSVPAMAAVAMAPRHGVAESVSPPGLSITLSDARAQTQSGASLTYTAGVTNAGADPLKATLVVTIPSYAAFVGATADHTNGANVSWTITVGAGKSITRKVTVRIGTIPKDEVRFTTIATLYPRGSATQILVRTADPDGIRGVVDPAHSVGLPSTTNDHPDQVVVLAIVIVGAAVIVALALLVWIRRRRRPWGSGE